jgi:lysophospholipase L1-like esterase
MRRNIRGHGWWAGPRELAAFVALVVVLVVVAVLAVPASTARAAGPALPTRMAALGDSITRGFDACGWYSDCPSRSWSTGTYSTVNSQYLRLKALNPALTGYNYNDAKTGAKMSALGGQVSTAVSQQADYVTILLGANDACTSSESTMTSVATFDSQLRSALSALHSARPNAQVFVASIPDIKRLWEIGKNSSAARSTWSLFGICQSMLKNPTSTQQADVDRRNRVQQRVVDFNSELAAACADYGPNCRFDGNAVFSYPFTLSQISTWDYFHPNVSGQAALASTTWAASQWAS